MIWVVVGLCLVIYFLVLYIIRLKNVDIGIDTKGNEKIDNLQNNKFLVWVNQLVGRKEQLKTSLTDKPITPNKDDDGLENGVIIKKVYNNIENIKNTYICPTEDVHDGLDKPLDVLGNVDVSIKKAATLFEIIGDTKITQEINPNNIDETLQAMSEEDNDEYTDGIGTCIYV